MQSTTIKCITAAILALTLVGCGPTKQEIVEREARYTAREATMSAKKLHLKERADRLIDAGEEHPPKPMVDPGHEIVNCISPTLSDNAIAIENMVGPKWSGGKLRWNDVVCGNTESGMIILNWRKWYCKGEGQSCVYSRWENGEPTFGVYLVDRPGSIGNMVQKMPGITYEFAPMATPLTKD